MKAAVPWQGSDWSDTMVWFGQILLYLSFTILYIWSLIFSDFPDLFRWLCWRRMLWLMFVLSCVCGARPELFAHSFVPARQARECHYHHFNFKFQSLHSQSMYIHVFHFISQLKNENLSGRQLLYIFSF